MPLVFFSFLCEWSGPRHQGVSLKDHKHMTKACGFTVRHTLNCMYIYTFILFTDADVVTHKSRGGQCFHSDIWALCLAVCYYVPLFRFLLKLTHIKAGRSVLLGLFRWLLDKMHLLKWGLVSSLFTNSTPPQVTSQFVRFRTAPSGASKGVIHFFTYEVVLPMTCKQTLMFKIGGVPV